ncbi:MAG: hypothetical protein WD604_06870 [Balneolaceae bacterium]
MCVKNVRWFIPFLFFCFTAACSQNDEQRAFERDAFSASEGYTQTTDNSETVNEDPDDWRVSPFYQGLVSIDPAFPNPAAGSENITINFHNHGIETVSGLIALAYYSSTGGYTPLGHDYHGQLPTGPTFINFQGSQVAQFPENPQGLYRVIILDGNENVISYGDVQIE